MPPPISLHSATRIGDLRPGKLIIVDFQQYANKITGYSGVSLTREHKGIWPRSDWNPYNQAAQVAMAVKFEPAVVLDCGYGKTIHAVSGMVTNKTLVSDFDFFGRAKNGDPVLAAPVLVDGHPPRVVISVLREYSPK